MLSANNMFQQYKAYATREMNTSFVLHKLVVKGGNLSSMILSIHRILNLKKKKFNLFTVNMMNN